MKTKILRTFLFLSAAVLFSGGIALAESKATKLVSTSKLHKPLPETLTSFGACVVDEYLYVFSGHSGDAHGFGKDLLVDHFRRIKFDDPAAEWEELAMHDSAQSTAIVTDGKAIYRIGGLSFLKGDEDGDGEEDAIFNSTSYFTRYDIEADKWTEMAPLPEPRSSLDAALVGRTIYAVGGWDLQGKDGSQNAPWHETMHAFDLDNPDAGWQTLDGPGYDLRAISCAAHNGKLYVLGGISPGGFLRKTSVFDPETKAWSEGPELVADSPMTGFATSTFAVGGHLYSTGASGVVYRLASDGSQWEVADRLLFPRMFLRLLPVGDDRLIALGGTGGFTGRTAAVETLKVDPSASVGEKIVSWSVPYDGKTKHSQSLVLDGTKLYAFGGNNSWQPHDFSEGAFEKEAFVFDIPNQTVERLPDMPMPVQSGAGFVNTQTSEHKTLVVAGGMNFGEDKFEAISSVLEFDPEANVWNVLDNTLPQSRAMACAASHNDAIWIFGGSDAGSGGSKLRDDILHWWGDASAIAPLPEISVPHPRRSFGGAVVGKEYFMVGGLGDGMSIETTVDVFDMENRTWRTAASPSASRVFPMVAVDGKKLYLFGGFSNEGGNFSECKKLEVYDTETDRWSVVAESIEGVDASMRLFNLAGRLLFFGIDRETEGQAKFVLYDPNPTQQPEMVAAMSFGGRSRGGSEAAANAKMMMRKDTDKDGKLSLEELGSRMSDFFKAADTDGDSLVSFAEAKAKLEADEAAEKAAEKAAEEADKQASADKEAPAVMTSNQTQPQAEATSTAEEAQLRADALQRKASAAQRKANAAQRKADAAQRQADALRRKETS